MKTIVVSALVLMLFAGVAGTIQAIHASKSGLFDELYQPKHHVLSKNDIFYHTTLKKQKRATPKSEKINRLEIVKNPLHTETKTVEPIAKYTIIKNMPEVETIEIAQEIAAPLVKKDVKKPRKFKASMFSRGALDKAYLEDIKVDSSTILP